MINWFTLSESRVLKGCLTNVLSGTHELSSLLRKASSQSSLFSSVWHSAGGTYSMYLYLIAIKNQMHLHQVLDTIMQWSDAWLALPSNLGGCALWCALDSGSLGLSLGGLRQACCLRTKSCILLKYIHGIDYVTYSPALACSRRLV